MQIIYVILIIIPVYLFYLLYGLIKRLNITSKIIGLILGAVWTYLAFIAIFATEHTISSLIAGTYIYSIGGWQGLFLTFMLPFGALIGMGEVIAYSRRKSETLVPLAQRNWFLYGLLIIPALGLVIFNLVIPQVYFGIYLDDLDASRQLFKTGGEISECSKIQDERLRSHCESNLKPKDYANQHKLYQQGQCEKITDYSLRYFCTEQMSLVEKGECSGVMEPSLKNLCYTRSGTTEPKTPR